MVKGNVVVIGNSGVGKSTLINTVLGETKSVIIHGKKHTPEELKIYTDAEMPFRLIEPAGFEANFWKEKQTIQAVQKWIKNSVKQGNEHNSINLIWFCVDGTERKLLPKTIQNLIRATAGLVDVPIIVVITKSYFVSERLKNFDIVCTAFAKNKKAIKRIIPVVAEPFWINDFTYAQPEGITDLIDATNTLMPEGIKAAKVKISKIKLNRRRGLAHSVVIASVMAGAGVGFVNKLPGADILTNIESGLVYSLAKIYGVTREANSKQFIETIIESGTVSSAAKALIKAVQAIPAVALPARVINAVVAGCIIVAIGEVSICAFEQIYLGKRKLSDINWVQKMIEDKLSDKQFMEKIFKIFGMVDHGSKPLTISQVIIKLFK